MGAAQVHYFTRDTAIATVGDVFVQVLRRPPTMDVIRAIRPVALAHRRRVGAAVRSIAILEQGSLTVSIPSDVRAETDRITTEFQNVAAVTVIEGSGFAATTARALLAGIYLTKRGAKHKIASTAEEGARWLDAHASGPDAASAAEILAAIASARAAIGSTDAA